MQERSHKSRAGQHWFPYGSRLNAIAKPAHALLKAHDVSNAQHDSSGTSGIYHLLRFACIHSHRLLDQYGLAAANCVENVRQVRRVRRGYKDGIHVRRGTHLGCRCEGMRDAELVSRLAGATSIPASQGRNSAVLGLGESRHYPSDGM
jgi:hypothetical protein